jgi:hypothetical protein
MNTVFDQDVTENLINRIRVLAAFDLDIPTIVETIQSEDDSIPTEQIFLCYHAAKLLD